MAHGTRKFFPSLEVFSLQAGERLLKATGVRLIECGLSYPVDGTPRAYKRAWEESRQGVRQYGDLSQQEALSPWELKRAFRRGDSAVEAHWVTEEGAAVTCKVTNTSTHLNEANVLVLKSLLPGAGLGLFLRPTPPTSRGPLIVPEDGLICVYSCTVTTANVDDMASTDYLIEVASGGDTVRFNPEVFNGDETGRFINQGGLIEGLEAMCRACDRDSGVTSYVPSDAHSWTRSRASNVY